MNVFFWLLISGAIGSLVGWAASVAVRKDVTEYVIVNIVLGAVGAILGASLLSPEFGSSLVNRSGIPLTAVVASGSGAFVLACCVYLCWHDQKR
jgi:uncharacterized membrane protein YeaQ/YmgE (transglycosylase-associated protein family)